MSSLALILRRVRARIGLVVTIAVLVTATTSIIAGTVGYARAAATTAARQAISDTQEPTEAGIRVQTRLADDSETQDATARRLIADAFAPASVEVQRSLASEPRPVAGRDERLHILASDSLAPDAAGPELVEVVAGAWPAGGSLDGLLHVAAADRWGVVVGERLDLGDATVRVSGLWRPTDADAAFWFGDPLAATGGADGAVGPLLVDPAVIGAFGDTPFVRWTVQPDAGALEPDDLTRLADAATTLQSTLRTPEVEVRGVTVDGDLAPTAAAAARNLATARALNVVPLMLLLGVSAVAVMQLARLLAAARTGEVEVFVARGASRRQVVLWTAVEAAGVTLVGAGAGSLLAVAVLQAVPAGPAQAAGAVATGALVGLGVLTALTGVSIHQVRVVSDRRAVDRSGRTRTVAALGALVLTLAAATLAWWQLRRYGSPLVTDPDGTLRSDLLAGAAPTLLLAACAVVATALLGPLSRAVEGLTRPSRRLVGHLSAAQVSRHLVVYAVPVVLTVLAVGATTLAGLYAATSADLRATLADLGQGADVRATVASRPVAGQAGEVVGLPPVGQEPAVAAVAPVWLTDSQVGSGRATLMLAPLSALDEVAIVPPGAADPADLAPLLGLQGREGAVQVPAGTAEITVELEVTASLPDDAVTELEETIADLAEQFEEERRSDPGSLPGDAGSDPAELARQVVVSDLVEGREVSVSLRVLDPATGSSQTVQVGAVDLPLDVSADAAGVVSRPGTASGTFVVTLPGDDETAYLVTGLDVELPQASTSYLAESDVAVVVAGARLPEGADADAWAARAGSPPDTQVGAAAGGGLRVVVTTPQLSRFVAADRILVPVGPATPQVAPVPVAVTRTLAEGTDLSVGSPLTLQVFGTEVGAEVAALVDAVPGTLQAQAVLADTGAMSEALGARSRTLGDPTELWVAAADPVAAVEQVSQVPGIAGVSGPGSVSVTDAASAVRLVFWVASAGAVLLAVTGIAAVAATLLSARRPEVAVLRALGMPPAAQARARAAELAGVVLASVALGLGAGWLVGAAVVPELARSTTLAGSVGLPADLQVETGLWAAVMTLGGVAVAVVLTVLALRVRGQALESTYREEIR